MSTYKTVISIPKLDCPSEEEMIKMAFSEEKSVKSISCSFNEREAEFFHTGNYRILLETLESIGLRGELLKQSDASIQDIEAIKDNSLESKTLITLLLINFTMFIIEIILGIYADSTGLIADSLDMLADSMVYGLSLYAVGMPQRLKNRAASLSGGLQMILALLVLYSVISKFLYGSEPISSLMIGASLIALAANVLCLILLMKHRNGDVHMKASWIFSTNDVIANSGVILAGLLVYWLNSPLPDLITGLIISIVVFKGALTIFKISSKSRLIE